MREPATFGGGCFWCVEAVFKDVRGVTSVVSGYAGGTVERPTYQEVCTGRTGHAEVCRITYDPAAVSFADLLEIFFRVHDPTTLNRQGNDVGTQYRSVIFTHTPAQDQTARRVRQALDEAGAYDEPIVTEIVPCPAFYPAEEYHQDYFARNPTQAYCRAVVRPKREKFRQAFAHRLKSP